MTKPVFPNIPQHEKLKTLQGDAECVGEFIDWLSDEGIQLCEKKAHLYSEDGAMYPVDRTIEEMIAGFLGIDRDALEREKVSILNYQRQMTESAGDH